MNRGILYEIGYLFGTGTYRNQRIMPNPVCGDNDVVIKNISSSIYGTDIAVYAHGPNTGHWITVGSEFGHETISRIVAVGKNITNSQVGECIYPYPRYTKNDTC